MNFAPGIAGVEQDLSKLPFPLIANVASFLRGSDMANPALRVCRRWRDIFSVPTLWRDATNREFGRMNRAVEDAGPARAKRTYELAFAEWAEETDAATHPEDRFVYSLPLSVLFESLVLFRKSVQHWGTIILIGFEAVIFFCVLVFGAWSMFATLLLWGLQVLYLILVIGLWVTPEVLLFVLFLSFLTPLFFSSHFWQSSSK